MTPASSDNRPEAATEAEAAVQEARSALLPGCSEGRPLGLTRPAACSSRKHPPDSGSSHFGNPDDSASAAAGSGPRGVGSEQCRTRDWLRPPSSALRAPSPGGRRGAWGLTASATGLAKPSGASIRVSRHAGGFFTAAQDGSPLWRGLTARGASNSLTPMLK